MPFKVNYFIYLGFSEVQAWAGILSNATKMLNYFCFILKQLLIIKFQKDLNNNSPHEAIDYIQNSSWKLSVFSV